MTLFSRSLPLDPEMRSDPMLPQAAQRDRYRSVVCELHVMILKIGHRATDFNFLYLFQLILVTSEAKTGTQVFVSS